MSGVYHFTFKFSIAFATENIASFKRADNDQRVLEAAKTGGGGAEIVPANMIASIVIPRSALLTAREFQEFVMNNFITLYDSTELMKGELYGYGIELSNMANQACHDKNEARGPATWMIEIIGPTNLRLSKLEAITGLDFAP